MKPTPSLTWIICALALRLNTISAPAATNPTFSDANWVSMNPIIPAGGGSISTAVVDGSGNLYIGGDFSVMGGVSANNIAKWDGSHWSALGSGIGWPGWRLAVSGSALYEVDAAPGYQYVSEWNGSGWSVLGTWLNGGVNALLAWGGTLFAGGLFTMAGDNGVNYIAAWDGTNWSALGAGMNAQVNTLAVLSNELYAGGDFTTADYNPANRIARWDGTTWSAVGSGMNDKVAALAVSGSNLYAGGCFTTVTNSLGMGVTANYVAKWDGTNWAALGSGMNGFVWALAATGSDLYAGGYFTWATNSDGVGVPANYIAKWNGTNWAALGAGMNDWVYALAVSGSSLYAGGTFTTAGGKASAYVARAILNPGNWLSIQANVPGPKTNTLTFSGNSNSLYVTQFATNLTTSPWFTLATNIVPANGIGTVQDPAATNAQRFYRLGTR